jgi:hypothetical protein
LLRDSPALVWRVGGPEHKPTALPERSPLMSAAFIEIDGQTILATAARDGTVNRWMVKDATFVRAGGFRHGVDLR